MSALALVMTWNAWTLVGRLVTRDSAMSTMRPLGRRSPCLEKYVMTWSSRMNHLLFHWTPPFFVRCPSSRVLPLMFAVLAKPPSPAPASWDDAILWYASRAKFTFSSLPEGSRELGFSGCPQLLSFSSSLGESSTRTRWTPPCFCGRRRRAEK